MENKKTVSELLSRDVLEDSVLVRTEFISPEFLPKITLDYDSLTFNTACVRLFPETEYVQIVVNTEKLQLKVLPCKPSDADAVKWSINSENDKFQPRKVSAKGFCSQIFLLMDWNIKYRYKIKAVYQQFGDQKYLVFNLSDFEISLTQKQKA